MRTKSILISGLALVAVTVGLAYWASSGDEPLEPISAPPADIQDKGTKTIAETWQWKNFSNTKPAAESLEGGKPRPTAPLPYDAQEVYKTVQSIKVDENGHLVPDQTALQALAKGFDDLGPNLSPEAMLGLQALIRKGLPGPAGDEAAYLLQDYFRFRLAEADFIEQRGSQLSADEHYKQLVQLRRNYLGQEMADKLFAEQDTQARHMLAAVAIQQNGNLTADEKQAQQAALQEKMNARLLASGQVQPEEAAAEKVARLREQGASSADIYSTRSSIVGAERASELAATDREEAKWQSNFNGFWQARRYVVQAELDPAERERQIEQLLNQYFSPEERERARATSMDWQTRESK